MSHRVIHSEMPPPEMRSVIREAAGLTVPEFAVSMGVSPSTVWAWEAGTRDPTGLHRRVYIEALEKLRGTRSDRA